MPATSTALQKMIFTLYFDIDGVLNRCPQLGSRPFHFESDCMERMQRIAETCRNWRHRLSCISFHRGNAPLMATLPLPPFEIANPAVYKRFAVEPGPHLILDDQPHAVNGRQRRFT